MRSFCRLLIVLFLFLSGCAHTLSQEAVRQADTSIRFENLLQRPDTYIGKTVIVGGTIAGIKTTGEGTILEVVQFNLDQDLVPMDYEGSRGRFLATAADYVGTVQYRVGQSFTMVGEIKGKKVQKLEKEDYVFPVIAIREVHIWNDGDDDNKSLKPLPPFYDPYYSGHPGDQYRDRPIGPAFKRY